MRDTRQQAQYEPQYEQRIKAVTEKIMKKKKRVDPVLSDDVINMKEVTDICFVQ